MPLPTQKFLENCLYFTANSLARAITHMSEEEFKKIGLSSSHAFLIMLAIEKPGSTIKELAEEMNLAHSTVSRFVDALARKNYIEKQAEGKTAKVFPTKDAEKISKDITEAWKRLHHRYSEILGERDGHDLAKQNYSAYQKLMEKI